MSFKKNFKIAQFPLTLILSPRGEENGFLTLPLCSRGEENGLLTLSLSPWGRGQGEGAKGHAPLETIGQLVKRKRFLTGQALTELALFGSLFLLVLGVMVNYGMRSYYQEKASQNAFRRAMGEARNQPEKNHPISSSHMLIEDSNIPDPANPYGIGTISPFSGSASVTRNYKLQEVPEEGNINELPVLRIDDADFSSEKLKAGGFRWEADVPCSAIPKYKEIYGPTNLYIYYEDDGEVKERKCKNSMSFNILDSSAGEIIDYDATIRQCRQIIDEEACKRECERGRKEVGECPGVCAKVMNPPNQNNPVYDSSKGGAWYCADYQPHPDGQPHHYRFPVLDELFGIKEEDYHSKDDKGEDIVIKPKPRPMGLQQGFTIKTQMDNKITRNPHPKDGAKTSWDSNYITIRKALYHKMGTTTPELETKEIESDALPDQDFNN